MSTIEKDRSKSNTDTAQDCSPGVHMLSMEYRGRIGAIEDRHLHCRRAENTPSAIVAGSIFLARVYTRLPDAEYARITPTGK